MAAIMASTVCWLLGRVAAREMSHSHPWNIPLPPVLHRTLAPEFVDMFEEVLVIGDIHGCREEMVELIRENGAANDTVLKLFVGDLVNKGPKSKEVLEYVMTCGNTSCLSVRGNHDEVVIREYLKYKNKSSDYSLSPKNQWIKELSEAQVDYLISLPYTISVPSLNAVLVHAGLVPGLDLNDMDPTDMVTMRNLISDNQCSDGPHLKPDKSGKVGEAWAPLWPGPVHVYFGHDAKRMLQTEKFATGLDTGCVYGKQLTALFIKGPRKGSFLSVTAKEIYQPVKGDRL